MHMVIQLQHAQRTFLPYYTHSQYLASCQIKAASYNITKITSTLRAECLTAFGSWLPTPSMKDREIVSEFSPP